MEHTTSRVAIGTPTTRPDSTTWAGSGPRNRFAPGVLFVAVVALLGPARATGSRGHRGPFGVDGGRTVCVTIRSGEALAEDRFHSGGGVVLKIGQQISVAVNDVGSEGVAPM